MIKLVCPCFFTKNCNKNSKDYGKKEPLTNKYIYIIKDFNNDGSAKGQIIKAITDFNGKLFRKNSPVPLYHGKYCFYVSDEEVKDISKITKDLCTEEIEITDEFDQSVEIPIEDNIIKIMINAFIVDDTGWTEESVEESFKNAEIIFNKYDILIQFDINLFKVSQIPISTTKDAKNLSLVNIDAEIFHVDEVIGKVIGTNREVNFYYELNAFIFSKDSYDKMGKFRGIVTNEHPEIKSVVVLINRDPYNNSTVAHEIGHLLTLDDDKERNNQNLMNQNRLNSDCIEIITLTKIQVQKAKNNISKLIKGR